MTKLFYRFTMEDWLCQR